MRQNVRFRPKADIGTQPTMKLEAIVNAAVSLLLVLLAVWLYYLADSRPADEKLFLEGLFFWFLGLVFLLAKRYAAQVYLLNGIDVAFTKFAVVGGKYRTYIYGAGFCAVALIQQLRWLFADKL
jgi:FlaA1/EpsC-like NDP-sugar epimerase